MSTSETPEQFGNYHLLEKIATGGMAEVWRARYYGAAGFEKILVIKKVLPDLAADSEFVELFYDEGKIAQHLQHGNIVQIWALDEVGGQPFMAMEYVHGLDLSRLLSRARGLGPFPIPLALLCVSEILRGLHFAHDREDDLGQPLRIVHCDISPQNILISFAGEVKLADFGISRAAFQASEQHKVVRGKYAYMSPEQVEGRALDRRTDLFSLAIVLYEALTGRRLFKTKSRDQTLDRVRRAEVPSPRAYRSEVSEDLEAVLLKALSRKREDRYEDAGAFLEALTAVMVREGHRATSSDLATYLKAVIDAHAAASRGEEPESARGPADIPPAEVVVLAVEAAPPPRAIAAPRRSLSSLTQEWSGIIEQANGEVWERADGAMLLVWVARSGRKGALQRAVRTAVALQRVTLDAGYRLSAGLAPGVARLQPGTGRPADGWALAGPFYLARWMMNLSAHRGRVLLTEVGAQHVAGRTSLLGRIPIQGSRHISLHELA
ncbi:MAG: serine/threonine-protein kinase [Myxococcota bacterium]|nr:serine/threonine-protein kinase [Myxococcota bacterium]